MLGEDVGLVVELVDDAADALGRRLRDPASAVEDAVDRADRNAGPPGYLFDGRDRILLSALTNVNQV